MSSAAKPSRRAESWLPLISTTRVPVDGEPGERVVAERDRVDAGQRAVVHVAGDQDHVDRLGAHHLDEVIDIGRLRRQQVLAVQRPAQVPVGGVQQAHTRDCRNARPTKPGTDTGQLGLAGRAVGSAGRPVGRPRRGRSARCPRASSAW